MHNKIYQAWLEATDNKSSLTRHIFRLSSVSYLEWTVHVFPGKVTQCNDVQLSRIYYNKPGEDCAYPEWHNNHRPRPCLMRVEVFSVRSINDACRRTPCTNQTQCSQVLCNTSYSKGLFYTQFTARVAQTSKSRREHWWKLLDAFIMMYESALSLE